MSAHCEFCNGAAQWQFTEVVGGRRTTVHVCSECARQRGIVGASAVEAPADPALPPLPIATVNIKITQQVQASQLPTAPRRCAQCGTTLVAIRKSGRVGCPACYETFRPHLEPLLRRVHGALEHRGHRPDLADATARAEQQAALDHLREQLRHAIENEDFENAARLRDAIAQWHAAGREEQA